MTIDATKRIKKRDGSFEPFNLDKIHRVVEWACEGITGVSSSHIELQSQIQIFDKMESSAIQDTLIKTSADLITAEDSNYQYVASRLINFKLRKEVYGQPQPWRLSKIVERNISLGFYTPELTEWYTDEDWTKMNKFVKHDRDYDISYAGMSQWTGKYLVQNRTTKDHYETPQVAYMLIAATLFHSYPEEVRLKYVKDYYDELSRFKLSIPTPVLAGARTPTKQFSSCVLIDADDNLPSINATSSAIVNYVSQKAGIGLNIGRIRPVGSEVRGGEVVHTGVIPFLKYFQSALKSCSQGGVRGGAATVHYPYFHAEFENLIVAKNNKGTEETRVRHVDYSVQFNRLFYKRLIEGGNITLFSPHEVPDLMEAFYSGDNDLFEELYEKYERSRKLKFKEKISARGLIDTFFDERTGTGRIYAMNVDHANNHGSFDSKLHPISMSNLCQEITLPTKPFTSLDDPEGRIALCTLSAINWGAINKPEDLKRPCEMAVRGLDAILTYQNYPQIQAELATREFRTLGIGIINLAYFLAKQGTGYTQASALPIVNEYMEAMSYYLIRASVDLAKDFGPCEKWQETKYGKGIFPWEVTPEAVNELTPVSQNMPWEELRADMMKYGIRNATLMACMPSESSSQLANATNGVEPPRSFVSEKVSKDGVLKQVVPEYHKYKNKYELLWDQSSPGGYIRIMAVLQRYIDQTISANTSYNPEHYVLDEETGRIPLSQLIRDFVDCYRFGVKTLYYNNTKDGNDAEEKEATKKSESGISQDELPPIEDEVCDSCVL